MCVCDSFQRKNDKRESFYSSRYSLCLDVYTCFFNPNHRFLWCFVNHIACWLPKQLSFHVLLQQKYPTVRFQNHAFHIAKSSENGSHPVRNSRFFESNLHPSACNLHPNACNLHAKIYTHACNLHAQIYTQMCVIYSTNLNSNFTPIRFIRWVA